MLDAAQANDSSVMQILEFGRQPNDRGRLVKEEPMAETIEGELSE